MPAIRFDPIWPIWIVLPLAAGLLYFSWWTYRNTRIGKKRWMLACRIAAVLVVTFVFLRPGMVVSRDLDRSASVVVLLDVSRSMSIRDELGNQTRHEAALRALNDAQPAIDRLGEKLQVRYFEFARKLSDGIKYDSPPVGDTTAIGDTLRELSQRGGSDRILDVILLSDGASNRGDPPLPIAREFGGRGIPIHPFGLGKEVIHQNIRDISILDLYSSSTVFSKNRLDVRARLAVRGMGDRQVPVVLKFNGEEVDRQSVSIDPTSNEVEVELGGIAKNPGEMRVSVEVELQPGESLKSNNLADSYVTVRPDGLRVLYIDRLRPEQKPIRRALDTAVNIGLSQLILQAREQGTRELLQKLFAENEFDVLIIGDIDRDSFVDAELIDFEKRVSNGMGVMMIGGFSSFGAGGWQNSPLAKALPTRMETPTQIESRLQMLPTPEGLRHFIMRIAGTDDQSNLAAWKTLDPLEGGSRLGSVKPNALVLATSEVGGIPLLVGHDYGKGRSLAFAGDTTLRWRRTPESRQYHARFWRQMVLWLAHQENADETTAQVRLVRRRVPSGEKLRFEAWVDHKSDSPPGDMNLQAVVTSSDGKTSVVPLLKRGDRWWGDFYETDEPGDYTVSVIASENGKPLEKPAEAKFVAFSEDAELARPAADLAALDQIAKASGTHRRDPRQLAEFIEELEQRDLSMQVSHERLISLWDRYELLLLFVGILTAEWVLRKTRGLL